MKRRVSRNDPTRAAGRTLGERSAEEIPRSGTTPSPVVRRSESRCARWFLGARCFAIPSLPESTVLSSPRSSGPLGLIICSPMAGVWRNAGTRVAYRCSMLWHPETSFRGSTWGAARWSMTTELQSLYELRCATVHEGQVRPVADDVMLKRFLAVVATALGIVFSVALEPGLRSVEELLAWVEHTYPANSTIV